MKQAETKTILAEARDLVFNTELTEDKFDDAVNDIARRLTLFMNEV